jgi:hypothetical protein
MTKKSADTHKARQDASIVASLELLAAHPFNEVLSAEEERGLTAARGALRAWATDAGVIDTPIGQWPLETFMRFMALVVRSAVPLRSLPDHDAFRRFSDEAPF